MSDPRQTDPRYSDPRLSDPTPRQSEPGIWAWIAGIAVLVLVGFLVIAGWNHSSNTASNGVSPATSSSATRNISPPSTTGSGSTSPKPLTPAPMTPTPNKTGTQ
ncbi:MAG: hypothetical protein ACREB8_08475 [Pseudolabrys sp.]